MSVDITNWSEEPTKNGDINGMRLAASAPIANVGAMVATLMAAIKSGDVTAAGLLTQIIEVEEELDNKAPAFDSITNLEIYNMVEAPDGSDEVS